VRKTERRREPSVPVELRRSTDLLKGTWWVGGVGFVVVVVVFEWE
jgi:hypothetical protein